MNLKVSKLVAGRRGKRSARAGNEESRVRADLGRQVAIWKRFKSGRLFRSDLKWLTQCADGARSFCSWRRRSSSIEENWLPSLIRTACPRRCVWAVQGERQTRTVRLCKRDGAAQYNTFRSCCSSAVAAFGLSPPSMSCDLRKSV